MIGKSVGRYHILEQIGQGGMATVYKAYDTRLDREVAIKFIRASTLTESLETEMLARFRREALSLSKVSHPNILPVYDYGEYEGELYLVTAFMPGGTLQKMLGRPMPWAEAARLLAPVARALAYAHSLNIVHRDIKPGNILLSASGLPVLSDFGIAKILEIEDVTNVTRTGVGIGTPLTWRPSKRSGRGSITAPTSMRLALCSTSW
jgi:serine/threonine-protein kinase